MPVIDEYHALLTTNAIFVKRTANIGVMSPEMAISYGCTGPVLRGSGVDHDLRRDGEPRYTGMYDGYAFEVIVQKNGHYPRDHNYPKGAPRSGAGRLLASILRPHAGSRAGSRFSPTGIRSLQYRQRRLGTADQVDAKATQG
jgi:hypothetical protein